MTERRTVPMSRRRLLATIGTPAGSSAMYQAMTTLGLAAESTYDGPDPARGRPEGRLRPDPRSGGRRPCRSARQGPVLQYRSLAELGHLLVLRPKQRIHSLV